MKTLFVVLALVFCVAGCSEQNPENRNYRILVEDKHVAYGMYLIVLEEAEECSLSFLFLVPSFVTEHDSMVVQSRVSDASIEISADQYEVWPLAEMGVVAIQFHEGAYPEFPDGNEHMRWLSFEQSMRLHGSAMQRGLFEAVSYAEFVRGDDDALDWEEQEFLMRLEDVRLAICEAME